MVDKDEWQGRTGDIWAAEWRRTDRSFSLLTEKLIGRIGGSGFFRALDIGCGAGELSLALARGQAGAEVTGIDVSKQLIAVACNRASNLGNVEFVCADAANWQTHQNGPKYDVMASRHGVMFFADPVAAFTNLARQCKQGAKLVFSCFRNIGENPAFFEMLRLLPQMPPAPEPGEPGPFAFADPNRVTPFLRSAGWDDIDFTLFDFPMIFGAGADPVEDAVSYFSQIGPLARVAREMDNATRDRLLERVRQLAARHCHEGIVTLQAGAWIVSARRQ